MVVTGEQSSAAAGSKCWQQETAVVVLAVGGQWQSSMTPFSNKQTGVQWKNKDKTFKGWSRNMDMIEQRQSST